MIQVLAPVIIVIAVAALMLFIVAVTRAALDRLDRLDSHAERRCQRDRMQLEERPSLDAPNDWRQWAAYYRGLSEQARAEGNAHSASTYDSLAETYHLLAGDARGLGESGVGADPRRTVVSGGCGCSTGCVIG